MRFQFPRELGICDMTMKLSTSQRSDHIWKRLYSHATITNTQENTRTHTLREYEKSWTKSKHTTSIPHKHVSLPPTHTHACVCARSGPWVNMILGSNWSLLLVSAGAQTPIVCFDPQPGPDFCVRTVNDGRRVQTGMNKRVTRRRGS